MKKAYVVDGDQIEIVDRRQMTVGPMIPNFVFDIYGPVFKFDGLGLIATLYRLAGERGEARNVLHELMRYGSMGWDRLNVLLALYVELGFMTVKKPQGIEKRKHFKTTFEMFDPPTQVPSKYTDLIMEKTIIKSFFEEKIGEDLFLIPTVVVPVVKEEPKQKQLSTRIKEEYYNRISEARQKSMNYPKEILLAKKLVAFGESMQWSEDEIFTHVFACYDWLKNDPYWGKKSIGLDLVHRKIGEFVDLQGEELGSEELEEEEVAPGVHPDWEEIATNRDHPQFWEVGMCLPMTGGRTMTVRQSEKGLVYMCDQTQQVVIEKDF